MRTGACVSPSWPEGLLEAGYVDADWISSQSRQTPLQTGRAIRFESLDDPLVLSWMTRPRTDVGEAEFLEELSDIARMKVDAEPLGDDAFEVKPTPTHHPVLLTIRTRLDELRELSQLVRRKARLGTIRPVVDEALRTRPIEAMDPVTQGLAVHPTDLRRRAPIHSIPDRSQR